MYDRLKRNVHQVKAMLWEWQLFACITDKEVAISTERKKNFNNAEFQIIFISPEALVVGMKWRSMLVTDVYQSCLIVFVVDEAYCIMK